MAADRNRSLVQAQSRDGIKRSLLFAGCGMRAAYQAGSVLALQEAGLDFQHMDATSSGGLNLSMLLSGLAPIEMCQRWRNLKLSDAISFQPLEKYLYSNEMDAMADGEGIANQVYPQLSIDLQKICDFSEILCSYNILDFVNKQVRVVNNRQMNETLLLASMSLPAIFSPVRRNGEVLLDSGFVQQANVVEAVRQGAEEIWILWATGNSPEYQGGPLRLYTQMLEMASNGALNRDMLWVNEINQEIARDHCPYGQAQQIKVHILKPEYPLPLDSDLYLNKVSQSALIEMGYGDAKRYLRDYDSTSTDLRSNVTAMKSALPGIRFEENISGTMQMQNKEFDIELQLSVHVEDLDSFCIDILPQARVTGHVIAEELGGELLISQGVFQVMREPGSKVQRRLIYELELDDGEQHWLLFAQKVLRDDPGFDLWKDITSVQIELFHQGDDLHHSLAKGELKEGVSGFGKVMTSVRATGVDGFIDEATLVSRFGKFFMGEIYDTYKL